MSVSSNPKLEAKEVLIAGLALALWLVTVALGIWEVYVLRQLYYLLYARFARQFGGGDYESADAIGYCLLPILAFGFIAFAIALVFAVRMLPAALPMTDDWADNTIRQNVRAQVAQQIDAQFPSLPSVL